MPSDALPDDPMMLKAMLLAERVQNERLRQIIRDLQRHQFGRRAETLPEDQMLLGLEDVEQTAACDAADAEQATPAARQAGTAKRRANRGALPAHLPRIETTIDLDDKTCLCCQGALHRIGEDRSERLDIVPAQFRVLVTIRPKYACRTCEDGVVQASAPARLIEGGLPTEATIAQVLVSYMQTICLCTARRKSTPGMASLSTAPRWRTGWDMPPGICVRCTNACSTSSSSGRNCLPTRRRCRSWILAAVAPRSGSCGPMPPTTDHGADPIRRAWPMSTPQTAKPSGRSPISTASRACCRWMAMPATADWPSAATCSSRSAGSMCGVTATSSHLPVLRRLPAKRFSALLHCMRSRKACVASAPRNVAWRGSTKADR